MKGVFFISVFSFGLLGLMACRTVPQHLVREEVIIYHYEPVYVEDPPTVVLPPYDPPYTPVTNPNLNNPTPPRNDQTLKPNDGNSYGKRDPLQGGDKGRSEIIKSDPPVRIPEKNDRAQ